MMIDKADRDLVGRVLEVQHRVGDRKSVRPEIVFAMVSSRPVETGIDVDASFGQKPRGFVREPVGERLGDLGRKANEYL